MRNKPKAHVPQVPPSSKPNDDYRHADPAAIVSRQLTMLDWAQQALRNEMQTGMAAKGTFIDVRNIERLEKLSNAIVRAIDSLRKIADLTDELARRLTPEQLLEAALKKVEGQDAATIRYAIRRLRAYVIEVAGKPKGANAQMGDHLTVADAIGELE